MDHMHFVIDDETQLPPHLMENGPLCNGNMVPYLEQFENNVFPTAVLDPG